MNESDFINKIRRQVEASAASSFIPHPSSLIRGIGDDAAVLKATSANIVISTDLLIEDVDFKRDSFEPNQLGHKALAVSLSDIAAMAARPRWGVVSLGLPLDVWNSGFAEKFYEGYFQLARRYGVTLIGGDLSRTPDKIVIDSIVMGEAAESGAVFRSGAAPGDQIFVTGFLGDAAAGLRLLERGARLRHQTNDVANSTQHDEAHPLERLLLRQLQPEPRVGWGLQIGEKQIATAMIDISDGLSSDLNHLCAESNVGALIDSARIPIDPLVVELTGRRALDPLMLALHGGEDFELLFTVAPDDVAKLPRRVDGVPLTCIGEIRSAADGVHIAEGTRTWKLEPGGWEHFKK